MESFVILLTAFSFVWYAARAWRTGVIHTRRGVVRRAEYPFVFGAMLCIYGFFALLVAAIATGYFQAFIAWTI